MKKVLIIIGKLYIGGAERIARDIGLFSDHSEFEIHYLVFGQDIGAYEADVEKAGCRVIHVNSPSDGYFAYFSTLMHLIRKERYDVVHSHTMFNSGWAMLAGKLCGVPILIAHSHSIRGFEKRGILKNTYEKTMRSIILLFATHLIACGEDAGNWLFGKKTFSKRGILLHNGIDTDAFTFDSTERSRIRTQLGLDDSFVIGHVGHLAPVKNQSFLLDLMPMLLKEDSHVHLLLLGDGSDRTMLTEKINALRLRDCVTMTGNVSDVASYMSAMDVFAFPSLYEGTPLALIEAQTNGLPCIISTNIPDDAILTDLVNSISLDDKEAWRSALLVSMRSNSEQYPRQIESAGYSTRSSFSKLYLIYRGTDR